MAMQSRPGAEVPGGTLELLPLAFARPSEALTRARAILAIDPDPYDASVAHQAAGIVLRDFGDVSSGIRELRIALRLARLIDSRDRQADVLATLGVALTKGGRPDDRARPAPARQRAADRGAASGGAGGPAPGGRHPACGGGHDLGGAGAHGMRPGPARH